MGVALQFAYALTDVDAMSEGFVKKLLGNLKDFAFAMIAGLAAILTLYFVNDGEFRYLILVGIIGGFIVSRLAFGKLIVRIRDALARLIAVPIRWIWAYTFGRLLAKARVKARKKQTQTRMELLMQLASNGFEN